ncbi:hypothetical protein B0H13DRAFT_1914467 [Mycena leptocephala]|nr:hypothetical protein B0H13DRAFT_1914467 [Mycena leptocephala]
MSACSFANLAELQPPVCPHHFANRSNVMTLYLNKTYDGHQRDFFQCVTHKCCFIVVIPPVNPSVYLTSPAQIAGFNANGDQSEEEEELKLKLYQAVYVQVANERKQNDSDLIQSLYQARRTGLYKTCTFSSQTYFDTAVGIIIQELNSPLGVPPGDFAILLCDMVFCAGCWCTFSVDAYNQHVQGGICSSHPTGGQVCHRELHDQEVPRPKGRYEPSLCDCSGTAHTKRKRHRQIGTEHISDPTPYTLAHTQTPNAAGKASATT